MSKSIGHEKQVLIVLLWSVLIFIGYNVLTAEASEKDDKKVCESYNGKWTKSSSGDDRYCHFDNDKDRQLYVIRPGDSLDGTGFDAEAGRIDLDMSDEEAANIEDDICDDENADSTDVYGCMSDKRKNQMKDIENTCDDVGGKMTKDGCETDGDGPMADEFEEKVPITKESEPITNNQDWKNTVDIDEGEKTIASPYLTVPLDKDDSQEERDEKVDKAIADYNEEADESQDDSTEADSEEENESEEDDDSGGDEEESDDSSESEDDDGGNESEEE